MPSPDSVAALLPRYDGVLLDAFGVLCDASGALPGAAEFVAHLRDTGYPFQVVTNDASRLPATWTRHFADLGLPADPGIADRHRWLAAGAVVPGESDARSQLRRHGNRGREADGRAGRRQAH